MNAVRQGCLGGALLVMIITCATAPARGQEIRIWPTAVVESESVLLSQVADLRGFDFAQLDPLGRIAIYTAPRPGGQIVVHANDIRTALIEAGANLATVRIVGSARCTVSKPLPPREEPPVRAVARKVSVPARPEKASRPTPPREPVNPVVTTGTTLEIALREFIQMRAAMSDGRIEARFSPASADVLQLTNPPHEFRIRSKDDRRIGLLSLEVDILRDGGTVRTVPIVVEASLVREVVVARRAINRGETIEGRALKLEARRFTDESEMGLADPSAAVGRQSSGFVQAGQMLTTASIQDKPLVARGQPVTIWMKHGGLVIRANGKAQSAGGLGDRIEVQREGARRKTDLLDAVVTGPGTVSVESTQVTLGAG